jgi:hypothetical protein
VQQPWWFPVRDLARHVLGHSALLLILTLASVLNSALLEVARHLIHSKFVFHMLVALEYAFLVCDTVVIGMVLIRGILNRLKRVQ